MRDIQVSTDVFARIWSLRMDGEDCEDSILRRVLSENGSPLPSTSATIPPKQGGLRDQRFGVIFPEGFQIERTYLGTSFRATVEHGQWVIDGLPGRFSKLNELSRAIGTNTENAWMNWFFIDDKGRRRPVSDLRSPESIAKRIARTVREPHHDNGAGGDSEEAKIIGDVRIRWCDDVRNALEALGGEASLGAIYKQVELIRRAAGRSVPPSIEATIRRTLEDYSSDSENFRGEDWFEMPEGKGSGVWALRKK